MAHTMPSRGARFKRQPSPSPYLRLAQELGYSKPKTARDNLRQPYQRAAITTRVLRECGRAELANELMAELVASVSEEETPPLLEAIHAEHMAECLEDLSQEDFRDKLRRGEATVADAHEFVRRSAEARRTAEAAERAALVWIREQGGQA